jgi:hypothetical protein
MNNPWQLVASGRYAEAVTAYTLEIRAKPTPFSYNNRATARALMGDLVGALGDYAVAGALLDVELALAKCEIGNASWLHA